MKIDGEKQRAPNTITARDYITTVSGTWRFAKALLVIFSRGQLIHESSIIFESPILLACIFQRRWLNNVR